MKKTNKKFSLNKNFILLALALIICIGAAGMTWAILKSVATPVVNQFVEGVEYRLSYDLNGGTGSVDDEVYVDNGEKTSYTFDITDQEPTREEFQFLGWADDAEADTADYVAGDSITLDKNASKKTVYAVWEPIIPEELNDFRLEFSANVPEGVTASVAVPNALEKTASGELYTFKISNALAKDYNVDNTGMRFLGWATSEFGDVIYACDETKPSISVTVAPGTTTLYAVWGFDYYITYDRNANDGSVVKYQKDNDSYKDDKTAITAKVDHNVVSVLGLYSDSGYLYRRPEHMLVGFAATANSTQTLQSVIIPKAGKNNALTVYAVWESGSFALVYDANGGKSAPAPDTVISSATSYTFTVTSEKPVKADNAEATFLGWSANPDATAADPTYAAGKKVTLTESNPTMTLYAVWEYTYRLNFNKGHATAGDVPKEIVIGPTTEKSVTITVPSEPIPVRDQYEFDYWAASQERVSGEQRYYDAANYSRAITLYSDDTNVTMYARMKPTNGVTLYLSNNNGNDKWDLQTTNDNTQDFCTFTIPDKQPTRSNYTFLGWSEDKAALKPTLFAGDSVKIDGDVQTSKTIYAVWKRYDQMRVFIDFNGGSYNVVSGSGCNETTTTHRNRAGSYEYIAPGATVHDFAMVTFEKYWDGLTQKLRFPTRNGYSVAGFAYVNDEGRLSTAISMKDSSLCTEGGVKGFRWNAQSVAAGTQTVILDKENPDGSKDYTLYTYIIWAKNAAKDKYAVTLDQNHSNSTTYNESDSELVKQVEKEASGNDPAVINTSYTFATSRFSLSSMANSRTGYKLLGFARTRDATSTEWAVSGSTLQKSIKVSQDDPDVVFSSTGGTDGGSSYTLNLYAVWERQQRYRIYADFAGGSYSVTSGDTTYTYNDYTWTSQQPLNQASYTWSAPSMGGTPYRLGFKFLGFSTDPNATTAEYTVSNKTLSPSITVAQNDSRVVKSTSSDNVDTWTLNLYAIYQKQRLYNLVIDYNGGTYNSSTSYSGSVQGDTNVDVYNYPTSGFRYPTRTGYKLVGLATSPDATEVEYTLSSSGVISPAVEFDTTVLTPTVNVDGVETYSRKLYAIWEEQREFAVRVDPNGGSFASNAVTKVKKTTDMDITEVTWDAGTLSIASPSKSDFRFLGYAYTKDAKVPDFTISSGKLVEAITVNENGEYVVNDTSTIPNTSTVTLYAVWEPIKYFRIRIDTRDGSYMNSSSSSSKEILITRSAENLSVNSYTFTKPSYSANSSVSRSGYSLYGYSEVDKSTTVFMSAPSSSGSSSPYTYTFSETITVTEGAPGVTTEVMDNGVTYVTKTIYPIWMTKLYYGNADSNIPATVTKYNDDAQNRVFDISDIVPVKKNFQFAGWTTSTSSMIPQYGVSGYVSSTTEPLATQYTLSSGSSSGSLYAVWWQRYTISYSANGGMENTTPTRESAYATLNYNSSSTKQTFAIGNNVPLYDENNSREFLGWSLDPNATTGSYYPGSDIEINGNADGSETATVLYAIWAQPTKQTVDVPAEPEVTEEPVEQKSLITTEPEVTKEPENTENQVAPTSLEPEVTKEPENQVAPTSLEPEVVKEPEATEEPEVILEEPIVISEEPKALPEEPKVILEEPEDNEEGDLEVTEEGGDTE